MVHLHTHSDYSLMDGIIKIDEYAKRVAELGQPAAALTDHGTLAGLVEHYFACKKHKIKPILGCEFYYHREDEKRNYHLTVLARNKKGFGNLIKLHNRAQENFYRRPRITDKDIKELGGGLIITGGCIGSYLAQTFIERGVLDKDWIRFIQDHADRFYLEIHDNGIDAQQKYNDACLASGYPCFAACDAHYLLAEHEKAHQVALAVQTKKTIHDANVFRFEGSGYWIRGAEGISLPAESIAETDRVAADVSSFQLGHKDWDLPKVEIDPDEMFLELQDQLFMRDLRDDDYQERLEYEFKVISENGFLPYFKIVQGVYDEFGDSDFVGWGRGSTGGSLVAYLMGITKIDPIQWGLYFERFLNPHRIVPPDIDMDFRPTDRQRAIHALGRFGSTVQIGAYGTFGPKEVLRSVSKAMEITTNLHTYIPNEAPVPTIAELLQTKSFADQVDRENNRELVEICCVLEGGKRSSSIHAAGVVLTDDVLPMKQARSGVHKGTQSTEWDMYSLEKLKYAKFDVLGLTNLETIYNVCSTVGERVDDIPLTDEKTYDLIRSGQTTGVFQWESEGFRQLIREVAPDTFDHLLDLNTLYRPGCLESGTTAEYVERRHGRAEVIQLHPRLNMKRYGLPLYQEEMMEMAVELAGFTLAEADELRKAIGKKEKVLMESMRERFIEGCAMREIEEGEYLWGRIETCARYTWNKAHAVAYTLISWWTAYLSANYPAQYFCELLNQADSADRRRAIFSEARRRRISLLFPDINRSERRFTVDDGSIRLGLNGIKYVGEKALDAILSAREDGPFGGPDDVKARAKVNKRALEFLAKAGAFGSPGSLDEQRDALGYTPGKRAIDEYWWSDRAPALGEVVSIHRILTKHGDPMAFVSVEHGDRSASYTVFPQMWSQVKGEIHNGVVAFWFANADNVLQKIQSADDPAALKVHIRDADGFLSFYSSNAGRPNVYAEGHPLATIPMDEDTLRFIDQEFGIEKVRA